MQSSTVEYRSSGIALIFKHPVLRFLLMGPITGILIGYVQVTAAVIIWGLNGTPDFYFRGGSGVVVTYLMWTIGGGIIGVAYGGLLLLFEHFTLRRIRPLVSLTFLLVLAFCVAAAIAAVEFQKRKLGWIFAPQSSAVALGLLVSFASSTRSRTRKEGE